ARADALDEGRVFGAGVDEGEDERDALARRLLEDGGADFVDDAGERLRPEVEDRLRAGDAHVVVEDLERGRARKLLRHRQLADARRPVDEDQVHLSLRHLFQRAAPRPRSRRKISTKATTSADGSQTHSSSLLMTATPHSLKKPP